MTWNLNLYALWEATPRTSAPREEQPEPVEDVAVAVLQYVEPYPEVPSLTSIAANARITYGDWRNQKHCWWCNVVLVRPNPVGTLDNDARTKEHLMPSSFGGPTNSENIVAACSRCNRERQRDLTWVPYADHKGDRGRMSPSQRLVFQKFRK